MNTQNPGCPPSFMLIQSWIMVFGVPFLQPLKFVCSFDSRISRIIIHSVTSLPPISSFVFKTVLMNLWGGTLFRLWSRSLSKSYSFILCSLTWRTQAVIYAKKVLISSDYFRIRVFARKSSTGILLGIQMNSGVQKNFFLISPF